MHAKCKILKAVLTSQVFQGCIANSQLCCHDIHYFSEASKFSAELCHVFKHLKWQMTYNKEVKCKDILRLVSILYLRLPQSCWFEYLISAINPLGPKKKKNEVVENNMDRHLANPVWVLIVEDESMHRAPTRKNCHNQKILQLVSGLDVQFPWRWKRINIPNGHRHVGSLKRVN